MGISSLAEAIHMTWVDCLAVALDVDREEWAGCSKSIEGFQLDEDDRDRVIGARKRVQWVQEKELLVWGGEEVMDEQYGQSSECHIINES